MNLSVMVLNKLNKTILIYFIGFLSFLGLLSCSSDADKITCPKTTAVGSNLSLAPAPAPAPAVPVHANGKNTTWQWQLSGEINTGYTVDVYDVDLFETSAATISSLQGMGKKVICYFSAGSSENWRSDFSKFETSDKGKALDGWPGELWLDVRSQNVLNIMTARLDLAVEKGCDGVEPDNMDSHNQDSCFSVSADDQLKYNRALANLARSRGLSVALKNDPGQVADLVAYFDFSVTEECHQNNECSDYSAFTASNKPVFNAEYLKIYQADPGQSILCADSAALEIKTLVLPLKLDDSYRYSCD